MPAVHNYYKTNLYTNMRKFFQITAVCLLLCSATAMADTVQTLTINGEVVSKTVTKMTFEGSNVVLHFNDQSTQTADMSAVVLTLDLSGVDAIGSLKTTVTDKLDISGLAAGTSIAIYDASGRLALSAKATGSNTVLSLKTLGSGIYVMKAGKQIVKFVKR